MKSQPQWAAEELTMAAARMADTDFSAAFSGEPAVASQVHASEPQLDYSVPMAPQGSAAAVSTVTELEVREQLDRILNSKTFQQVQRLKRFVTFVVLETKGGRGDQLKEFVVGVQVFDKESSFDPRNDPIVRAQARRLRTRLATYYLEEGQNDEILIELPKGGYAAVFKKRGAVAARQPVLSALIRRNTVVVLPFADHSAGHEMDYFCQGISQEIIHTLSKHLETS